MKVVTSNVYPPSNKWCKNAYDADMLVVQNYTYYISYAVNDVVYFTCVRPAPDALLFKRIGIGKDGTIAKIEHNLPLT